MTGSVFQSRIVRVVTLVAFLVMMTPAAAYSGVLEPQTYWVDAINGDDTDLGTEAEPFKTITHALLAASSVDTVMVEPGTYDVANGETFPLAVYGETLISTSGAEDTILYGDGAHNVIGAQGFTDGDMIKGFTITNGGVDAGAGMRIFLNSPTGEGWPRIEGNIVTANASSFGGGALTMFTGSPIQTSPLIISNTFTDNSAIEGGAVRVSGYVDARVEDNIFAGNAATSGVGGALVIASMDSTITIVGNTFADNSASNTGGAIYMSNSGTTEVINGNAFIENEAGTSGGAMWLYGVQATVAGNEGSGNHARGGNGGFAYLEFTSIEAENNIIGGHSATGEGAVWYLTSAYLSETNDTVVECTGTDSAAYAGEADSLYVYNSVYWNPTLTADIENADIIEYSCLYDTAASSHGNTIGSGVIYDDPQFIDLAGRDARLGLGSPCVDTANTALGPAGDFFGTLRPQDGDGDASAVADMGYFEKPPLDVTELQGPDRYATAVAIAAAAFDASEYAVIASGENYPDALSASGLAGAYECPLVLTRSTSLPGVTVDFLMDLGVEHVFIVGGTAAISQDVYDQLAANYDVVRIAGDTRYATAAEVAQEIAVHQGSEFMGFAFVARGDSFPDALSLSPLAFSNGVPILLTRPTSLPAETADALDSLDIEAGVVAGGLGAVSATTKDAIDAIVTGNGGKATERWSGEDRYDTAVQIATNAVTTHLATWDNVGIATGQNYPDALAGGARIGMGGGVVLLTRTDSLPAPTVDALTDNAAAILYVDIFGGPSAVSAAVRTAIEDALGW